MQRKLGKKEKKCERKMKRTREGMLNCKRKDEEKGRKRSGKD